MATEQGRMNEPGFGGKGSSPNTANESSDQIRREIRRTRAEMDETVDRLGERLRPRHLLDDVLEFFKSGSGGSSDEGMKRQITDAGSTVLRKLKQHPVPAALIAAGITWLFVEDNGPTAENYVRRKWDVPEHSGSFVDARTGQPYDETYGQEYTGNPEQMARSSSARVNTSVDASGEISTGSGGGMIDTAKEKLGQAKDAVAGAASSAMDSMRSAGQGVAGFTGQARSGASSMGRTVQSGYQSGKQSIGEAVEEYPFAVGMAALAVGVFTGLMLPRTRREDELMGEASQRLKDQAKEAGSDLVDRSKQVASNTAQAASEKAGEHGMGVGQLGQKIAHVVTAAKDAAADAAKQEGLTPGEIKDKAKDVAQHVKETAKSEARDQKDQMRGSI